MAIAVEPVEPTLGIGIVFPLTFLCGVLLSYLIWVNTSKKVKLGNQLPGPRLNLPELFLDAIKMQPKHIMEFAIQKSVGFENLSRTWLGSRLVVFLYNADDIEIVLSSNVHLEKSKEYKYFEKWLGDGLLITKGDKWKTHRKLIAPTFHMNILKSFVPTFYKNSMEVVEKLKKEVGHVFDIHDYMSEATVDILLETAMGYKGRNKSDKSGFDYAMAVMKMCYITHLRHYKYWLRLEPIFNATKLAVEQSSLLNTIHSLTKKVFENKKKEFLEKKITGILDDEKTTPTTKNSDSAGIHYVRDDLDENDENDVGEKKRMAFLDSLMHNCMQKDSKISEAEVQDEINTIMFEGHDTTAAGSSFFLCVLGALPEIQTKVVQELREIFQGSDRPCTFADTLEMKYLERVILETLRLYPPVPAITREIKTDMKLASGDYSIPANTTVVVTTYLLHRMEKYYPNATVFDPDRFLPEECQKRHFYSFIPFSAGPRSCVGRKYAMLKLKVLLSTIVRNYKITSNVPESEFRLQADIILKRSNGFTIQLEERKITA